MMKKLLSLLLALMMGLGCIAFAEGAEAYYVDTWIAITLESGGQTIDLTGQDFVVSMTLNADGTCVLDAAGDVQGGTWAVTETGITTTEADGSVEAYTLTDGKLSAASDSMKIVFARQSEVALAEENGADEGVSEEEMNALPLSGLTAEAFNGVWTLSWVNAMHETYVQEALGTDIEVRLTDGMGYFKQVTGGTTTEYFGNTQIEEIAGIGTGMYLYFVDETGAQTGSGMLFFLFDNGQLVWEAQYTDGSWALWYFDQVIAEENAAGAPVE